MVYGAATKPPRHLIVQRLYHMPRNNIASVMELAPQLDKLMQTIDVSIGLEVPIVAEDHETIGVVYRFHSMDYWGESQIKWLIMQSFNRL